MPYTKKKTRYATFKTAGDLNFRITELIRAYINTNGGLTYQKINDVCGAMHEAYNEFRERVVKPYEIFCREHNGDVYSITQIKKGGLI